MGSASAKPKRSGTLGRKSGSDSTGKSGSEGATRRNGSGAESLGRKHGSGAMTLGRKHGSGASTTSAGSSQPGQTGGGLRMYKINSSNRLVEPRVSSLRRGTRAGTIGGFGSFFSRDGDSNVDDPESLEMSASEASFLPRDVRERLSQFTNGMLPPAPALFPKPGAALFVDIAGFTSLGDQLRQTSADSKQAADRLARQITYVLGELTRTCLTAGGDVAKFAGDALLCTFQGGDEDECLVRAQNCAIDMLMGMRRYNNSAAAGAQLQIHGGISKGSLLHFHLGSSDDELRWYLVAGDAVAAAVSLVEQAMPGQILLAPRVALANGKVAMKQPIFKTDGRSFGSIIQPKRNMREPEFAPVIEEDTPIGFVGLLEEETPVLQSSVVEVSLLPDSPKRISKRHQNPTYKSRGISEASDTSHISYGSKVDMVAEDGEKYEIFALTADTPKVELGKVIAIVEARANQMINAIYDTPLHSNGNAYIPKALRAKLRTGFNTSEMRSRVSAVFVGMQNLALSDQELATHVVSGEKLDELNNAFVSMTRVAHSFDGEVRDLLFDDKGCIFIAVFGAHGASELSELKATKYAMAIVQEFPKAKVGVSVGTCFVGMCGSQKRHDFVVMGHDVNVAARCMVVAQEGEVLVSAEIEKETSGLIEFEKVPIKLHKRDNENEETYAYRASSEIARRPSFLAQYRYGLRDRDLFVGRTQEINIVEQTAFTVCFGAEPQQKPKLSSLEYVPDAPRPPEHVGGSGIILVEAQAGMGKSAFVSRVKKIGKGRVKIASTAAFSLEQDNDFFVMRHLVENYTGFRRDMTREQLRQLIEENGPGEGEEAINLDTLREMLPWLKDVLQGSKQSNAGATGSASKTLTQRVHQANSFHDLSAVKLYEKLAREVMKILMGFRGELTLNQILAGEANNGAMLIIEDIQWMDIPSLHILRYIVENIEDLKGVVLFLTTRTDLRSVARNNSMNDFMETKSPEHMRSSLVDHIMELAKYGPRSALTMQLHGLPKSDCDRLVARLLDAKDELNGVSPNVLGFVYDKTDGYPMYVVLLIEWIRDHKLISLNSKNILDWINPDVPSTASFPNTLADTMIARFDRLDVQTRDLLKIASTVGNDFDAITLTTLANLDLVKNHSGATVTEESVLGALKHAQELGVLTVKKQKGLKETAHKWRFKHDTMLQAIQSIIPTERANQLKALQKQMRQEVEKKKLVPLFAGFLGEVDDD